MVTHNIIISLISIWLYILASKTILFIGAVALVVVLFSVSYYTGYLEYTVFRVLFDPYIEANWDEISERHIVKSSIPITVVEKQGNKCVVSAYKFDSIVDHAFFPRGAELANKLSYDDDAQTLVLSCDEIPDEEKSRLSIWFAVPEAPKYAERYMYFVTPWEPTQTDRPDL